MCAGTVLVMGSSRTDDLSRPARAQAAAMRASTAARLTRKAACGSGPKRSVSSGESVWTV